MSRPDILIEAMTVDDLYQVMKIERDCFSAPWSVRSFLRDIRDNPFAIYLSAHSGSKLVGYTGGWLIDRELHITNLAVDREFRQQGIATELVNKLIYLSKERDGLQATLEVRNSNTGAIKLYQKLGFQIVGSKPGYYCNDNEDALVMWKKYDQDFN